MTEITLTPAAFPENLPGGTIVGAFTANLPAGLTASYELVAGQGDRDNPLFVINGNTLWSTRPLDREIKASCLIRVRVSGAGFAAFSQALTITIADANDAPLDVLLSNTAIAEQQPAGSLVGTLSAVDQDAADSHGFALVAGAGDHDNARFTIQGATLRTAAPFDASATPGPFSVRIETNDGHGGRLARQFSITLLRAADTQPPVFSVAPALVAVTADSALLQWETNEPTTAEVSYGVAPALDRTVSITQPRKAHQLRLDGLTTHTAYSVRVAARDAAGNGPALSSVLRLTTLGQPASEAPLVIIDGPLATSVNETSVEIRWTTNEPASSLVSLTDGQISLAREDDTLVHHHKVIITGLKPSTFHQFTVTSVEPAESPQAEGGRVAAGPFSFTTMAAPDTLAPIVTEGPLVISLSDHSATIAWKTDEPATSLVEATAAGSSDVLQVSSELLTKEHQVVLGDLSPSTVYTFQVQGYDLEGNGPTISAPATFTTAAAPDVTAPRILSGPSIVNVTDRMATIYWTTDEPSNSVVRYGIGYVYDRRRSNPARTTEHQITLVNLEPATAYRFLVSSTDASGNVVESAPVAPAGEATLQGQSAASMAEPGPQGDFETQALPDTTAPVFQDGPRVAAVGDTWAVIAWTTDEIGDMRLEYGRSGLALDQFVGEIERRFTHLVMLTNLTPDTAYDFRGSSQDLAGNLATGETQLLVTLEQPDEQAPQLLGTASIEATLTTARVTWQTDELATSQLEFGTTSDTLTRITAVSGIRQQHELHLNGLAENTLYYYRLTSQDSAGNVLVSTGTFQTDATPMLDLGLTSELSQNTCTAGSRLTLTCYVVNNGPDAADDAVLTVTLPTALTLESADLATSQTLASEGTDHAIALGPLGAGEQAMVTLHLLVGDLDTTETFTIMAIVSSSGLNWLDANPANNVSADTLQYTPAVGTVTVNPMVISLAPHHPIPTYHVEHAATQWNGAGVQTSLNEPAGDYTVTWNEIHGWFTPQAVTQTLAADGTVAFTGIYEPDSLGCLEMQFDGDRFETGDTLTVFWASDAIATGSAVKFELWRGGVRVAELGSAWNPDYAGERHLEIPALPSASDYRLRMLSSWDPAFWIESAMLTIETRNGVSSRRWTRYE